MLFFWRWAWHWDWNSGRKYPDSVSLVRPPKTTIPNTLPADANSQYATVFEDVSGKKPFFPFAFACPSAAIFWRSALDIVLLKLFNGEAGACCGRAVVELLKRIFRDGFALTGSCSLGRLCFRHWWQMKKSLDRRGATRRSPGINEAMERNWRLGRGLRES